MFIKSIKDAIEVRWTICYICTHNFRTNSVALIYISLVIGSKYKVSNSETSHESQCPSLKHHSLLLLIDLEKVDYMCNNVTQVSVWQ